MFIHQAKGEGFWWHVDLAITVKELSTISVESQLTPTGGDGLVAARHLWHYGYQPTVFYPKQSKNDLYQRLATQLKNLDVPFTEDFNGSLKATDHVVDAIFGIALSPVMRLKTHTIQALASRVRCETLSRIPSLLWRVVMSPCYLWTRHRRGASRMVLPCLVQVPNFNQQL